MRCYFYKLHGGKHFPFIWIKNRCICYFPLLPGQDSASPSGEEGLEEKPSYLPGGLRDEGQERVT